MTTKRKLRLFLPIAAAAALAAGGCRGDEPVVAAEYDVVAGATPDPDSEIAGFYLLNEGNMGSNKCTLDYFDCSAATYIRNIYAECNPGVIMELGDVGNDIQIYGSRVYVVVNCSHKVEVLDARTGVRIGQVDIPNCRYVRFSGDKAYVSSYIGPVQIGADSPKGGVFEVDTASLSITRQVTVGYQPEELEIVDGLLYVANSGGYRAPDYDNTVSVVDLAEFKVIRAIPVDINLHRLRKDGRGRLWVSSRGNLHDIPSRLCVLEPRGKNGAMEVVDTLDVECTDLAIHSDRLYYISSGMAGGEAPQYGVIDVNTRTTLPGSFITDGTEARIRRPYGIAVNPATGDILLTDAGNYVSSGTLYCFSPDGSLRWSVRTGDIPAAIAFLHK